jgi:hypothetical protein
MFSLFGRLPSYQGSTLERLVKENAATRAEFNDANRELFAQALTREYPRPFEHLESAMNKVMGEKRLSDFSEDVREKVNSALAFSFGHLGLIHINMAAGLACKYGTELDQLKSTNPGGAFAIASILAQYVDAGNLADVDSEGGYRRQYSAFLFFRDALKTFGVLDHWHSCLASYEADQRKTNPEFKGPKLDDEQTANLKIFVPRAEQPALAEGRNRIDQLKNAINMMGMVPGLAETYLQLVFNSPQMFMPSQQTNMMHQWPGQIPFGAHQGFGGLHSPQPGPRATQAAQMMINAGINPFR